MNVEILSDTQPQPKGMMSHSFAMRFNLRSPVRDVWRWLNDPRTFIDGQLPPYRVEFLPERFEVGVLNNHHGPSLNLPAIISVMEEPQYREMRYLYGSYIGSIRLIRPTTLKFWLEKTSTHESILKVELISWVHPWVSRIWTIGQAIFWRLFGYAINRQVASHTKRTVR